MDAVTIFMMSSFLETLRSFLDYIIFKIQRKSNLSNSKKEKLNTTITLLLFYFFCIIIWPLFCLPSSLFKREDTIGCNGKRFYLIQISFWLSCSIRNVEEYVTNSSSSQTENKNRSIAATLYLIGSLLGYFSGYALDGLCILFLHYISEFCYQLYRLFYIFEVNPEFTNRMFQLWSILFVFCRLISMLWTSFIDAKTLFPVLFIQIYLLWSFTVLQLAKAGIINSQRCYENGEIQLKTPRIFRKSIGKWLKSSKNGAKLKTAKLRGLRWLKPQQKSSQN